MGLDGGWADEQLRPDLVVTQPTGEVDQDLALAGGEGSQQRRVAGRRGREALDQPPHDRRRKQRVSAGERYARIYEINLSRCIFCGYCELACPFDAITLGNDFELSEYSRDDLIYTKDMLLAEPIKRVPVQDPALYDTPIPAYKTSS